MKVALELEEQGKVVRSVEVEAADHETISVIAQRFAEALGLQPDELLEDLSIDGKHVRPDHSLRECNGHGRHFRHRRVCIDLHFETEEARHHFPAKARWARVHEWGCKKFTVAHDACANLELHEGSPDGPALNEDKEIGHFADCKVVWLVKPGPEPNGYPITQISRRSNVR